MRTSGQTTVPTTTSLRAILLSALLAGTALVGTAAYARAAESPSPGGSAAQMASHAAPAGHAPLTQVFRPRFPQPLTER